MFLSLASSLCLPCRLACHLVLSVSGLSSWSFTNSKTLQFFFLSIHFFSFLFKYFEYFSLFLATSSLSSFLFRIFFFFFRRSLILAAVAAASLSTVPIKAETDNNKSVVPKSITRRHRHQTNFPANLHRKPHSISTPFLPSLLHITSAYTIPSPWLGKWGVNQREKTHAVTMGAPCGCPL